MSLLRNIEINNRIPQCWCNDLVFGKSGGRKGQEVSTELNYDNDGKCYFCSITLEKSNGILRQAREKVKRNFEKFAAKHEQGINSVNNRWKEIEEAFESFDLSLKVDTVLSDPKRFPVPYWNELEQVIYREYDLGTSSKRAEKFRITVGKGQDETVVCEMDVSKGVTIEHLLPRLKSIIIGEGGYLQYYCGYEWLGQTILGQEAEGSRRDVEHNSTLAEEAVRISNRVLADQDGFETLSWSPLREHEIISHRLPEHSSHHGHTVDCYQNLKIRVPICPICSDRFQVSESYY